MAAVPVRSDSPGRSLPKSPTGIRGLDEITRGGLPRGRPTLLCGAAGCGKTIFAVEFIVRGATAHGEPGVFVAFEERPDELAANVRSLGFDLEQLTREGMLLVDHIDLDRTQIDEIGEYDLDGLFVRLGHAIDSIGAKRVVIDTIETLFGGLSDHAVLRSELVRLFRWLKGKGVTSVITCERGESGTLSRHGIEEYVSDCVILLDHRIVDEQSTRRLRILKYRGSSHGTDEYPFLIDQDGVSVLPLSEAGLDHQASLERVTTGVPGLDDMLGGEGLYRGSTMLVSGTAGTGKTSLAAHFAAATCRRGERCLFFLYEESPAQVVRNMQSLGLDLQPWIEQGLLRFHATRPSEFGMEMHLVSLVRAVDAFRPSAVILDPVTSLLEAGAARATRSMLIRTLDYLKDRVITAWFTSLTSGAAALEQTAVGVSSLMDTWLLLRDIEVNAERNRAIYVLKSRGMAHSNQVREFLLTAQGIELLDVEVGPDGVLTGSARHAQSERSRAELDSRREAESRRRRALDRKRRALDAQVAALYAAFDAEVEDAALLDAATVADSDRKTRARVDLGRRRQRGGDRTGAVAPNGGSET